jgi:hypothetical protein
MLYRLVPAAGAQLYGGGVELAPKPHRAFVGASAGRISGYPGVEGVAVGVRGCRILQPDVPSNRFACHHIIGLAVVRHHNPRRMLQSVVAPITIASSPG